MTTHIFKEEMTMSKEFVFRAIAYIISSENIDDSDLLKVKLRPNKDYSINIYNKFLGMFSSKDLAEKRIREYINRDKGKYDYDNVYLGFIVIKHELNAAFSDQFDGICNFSARYTYDHKGNPFCESELDDVSMRTFDGRKTPVKINVGEIAFVHGYGSSIASPVIVTDLPLSHAQWKRHMAKNVKGDYTDDCYTVVQYKFGHYHPNSVNVFPFNFEYPKGLQAALLKEMNKCNREFA